jgi:hypothetical protein
VAKPRESSGGSALDRVSPRVRLGAEVKYFVDQEDEGGLDQGQKPAKRPTQRRHAPVIALPERVIGIGRNGRSAWPESAGN